MIDQTNTADLTNLSPDDELDLEGFGLQPFEDNFLIVSADIQETENGRRWVVEMEPTSQTDQVDNLINGKVQDSGYLTHVERNDLVRIGMGNLKKLFKHALGRTNGKMAELEGVLVYGRVTEDKSGYARIRILGPARD